MAWIQTVPFTFKQAFIMRSLPGSSLFFAHCLLVYAQPRPLTGGSIDAQLTYLLPGTFNGSVNKSFIETRTNSPNLNQLFNRTEPSFYYSLYPEFDFRVIGDGRSATARYANNSNYRNDSLIRKESRFYPRKIYFKGAEWRGIRTKGILC